MNARQVSRRSHPSGTDGDGRSCGSLVKAQASARVDVPTALHFCASRTKESNTCVQFFFLRESLDMFFL